MLRIEKAQGGLSIALSWRGVVGGVIVPLSVQRKEWGEFGVVLLADIRWSTHYARQDLGFTERRVELSGCPDERRAYGYLRDNPGIFQALVEIFGAGEMQAQRENTRLTERFSRCSCVLFGGHGIERNGDGNDTEKGGNAKSENKQDDDGKQQVDNRTQQQQQSEQNGLNYEVQASTRPGLGYFACVVGQWRDVEYLRNRTPFGYTSLITTEKQVRQAIVTALPGEIIALIPNKREDATGMQCLFARERTEGINITQEEISLLSYALTAISSCVGDGMTASEFGGFRHSIHSRRNSLSLVAFSERDHERERIVADLFDSLMLRSWDYASGIIPFE
jgi:hypothetical protein